MRLFYFVLITVCFAACSVSTNIGKNKISFADNIVIAHRGAFKKNNLPENSIASLKHAIELKCTGAEFDVRMTADDSLIINHDPDYNKLPVEKTNYTDLLAYKLSNGEKLPTLKEYIRAGMENNISTRLVCEIKPSQISKERGKIIAEKTVRLIQQLNAQHMVEYISFDYDMLKKIIEVDPKAITHYLEGDKTPEQLKADGISGADYHFSVFKNHPDWIERAKKNNIILNAWTVNDASDMDWLLANDFDFITTNEPELLFERIKNSPTAAGWKLFWSEEFNYKGLPDTTKWNYQTGGGGFGNNELQYYTNAKNAMVANGVLSIEARREKIEGMNYTSARMVTKGKAAFLYGRFEIKAKLPTGRGLWPAIWMMPAKDTYGGWPASGEIDIMEQVGYAPDSVHISTHTREQNWMKKNGQTSVNYVKNATSEFHVYRIDWTPESIEGFIDGKKVFEHLNNNQGSGYWPFDQPFYLILNVAVGGNWGGKHGVDDSIFPKQMDVDYIRIYKMNDK